MAGEFWLGIAQTTIGTFFGFVLGIAAFHYQQHRQSAERNKANWRAALDALNRLTAAAGSNVEALANVKLQLVNDLRPEVAKMQAAVEGAYKTPSSERATEVSALRTVSESMHHFYKSLPRTSIMPPPAIGEYSSLSKDMPALTFFVHRAVGMMQDLNEVIDSRNTLIAEQARESTGATGMRAERLMYFSNMLAGQGMAICMHVDNAMDFWRLVLDQVKAYMTAKAEGEHFFEFKLVPMVAEAMPKDELFPLAREQIANFRS